MIGNLSSHPDAWPSRCFSMGFSTLIPNTVRPLKTKKADVAEHPKVFEHVGLLFNKPTGRAGLFFG
jgi:hypothetical protein